MNKARYLTNLPDNKNEPFGGAFSVYDDETVNERNEAIKEFSFYPKFFNNDKIRKDFLNVHWVLILYILA